MGSASRNLLEHCSVHSVLRPVVCLGLLVLLLVGAARAAEPIVTGVLEVRGHQLTLVDGDADQVVDVGERATIRTCYAGVCGGETEAADGLRVVGELSGPELPEAVQLSTAPGGTFLLPSFQQEGAYSLANLRLVNGAGTVLADCDPPLAMVQVHQIVVTSTSVSALTLEDLRARGIALSQESFSAFSFAVGFAFGSETVSLELPVLYEPGGIVTPLAEGSVNVDGLPPDVRDTVDRWTPPSIAPFALELTEEASLSWQEEQAEPLQFPLLGAIVLPGTVSFLHQFVDAQLIVANGAPPGSEVVLADLAASLRLPSGGVLRLVGSAPAVAPGQAAPVLGAGSASLLGPGEQGMASWTVEGLVPGTHTLQMAIAGAIQRPGRDPYAVVSQAQAAVDVVDARFHLTFSHPEVVREGSEYGLYVTVSNLSPVPQNLVSVALHPDRLAGAHPADPADDLIRTIDTLTPGDSTTLEYRLVAEVTGEVVAATFASSGASGSIELIAGVGELGIPLSPASLRLPRFSERMGEPYLSSNALHDAAMRFLGLAYSLAVAPAGMAPDGLPHVTPADVTRRAVELAWAGQRTFLGADTLSSLELLLLDLLGHRAHLPELDTLRRRTEAGLALESALGELLRIEQDANSLSAAELVDHLAATTAHSPGFVTALLAPPAGATGPVLEIRRGTADGVTYLAYPPGGADAPLRSLPHGGVLELARTAGSSTSATMAVVGHVTEADRLSVCVHNQTGAQSSGRLLALAPGADGALRRIDAGQLELPAHTAWCVEVGATVPSAELQLVDLLTGAPVDGVSLGIGTVPRPPFRLLGARQDFQMGARGVNHQPNRYGQGAGYLFNRPPDPTSLTSEAFVVESLFDGLDTGGQPAQLATVATGEAVFVQESEDVVAVRFDRPISPLVDPADGTLVASHRHSVDTVGIVDDLGEALEPVVPPLGCETEPLHTGGLVAGQVLRGSGAPVDGATVMLLRQRRIPSPMLDRWVLDRVATAVTGTDGRYGFQFIEEPHPDPKVDDPFLLRAVVPPGPDPELEPGQTQEVTASIRMLNRVARINIALLGRGTVTGRLLWADSGEPVSDGTITVTSGLFAESFTTGADAGGEFVVRGAPVGPLTVAGRDSAGHVAWASTAIDSPGDTADVTLRLTRTSSGTGTIVARVVARMEDGGELAPVADADVAVASDGVVVASTTTDPYGQAVLRQIPAGQVTVQAAQWAVSRTPALVDLSLAPGESRTVELVLAGSDLRSVVGSVVVEDPISGAQGPVAGAPVLIPGPGVSTYSRDDGSYRIEGVPVQGAGEAPYTVHAISQELGLEGRVALPPVLESSPDVITAQPIVLEPATGGIDGVVLDPYGRPAGGIELTAWRDGAPYLELASQADGTFAIDHARAGEWKLYGHHEDGLADGYIGWIGSATTQVVAGHRPFVTVRLVGAGVLDLSVSSSDGTPLPSQVFIRPTVYSSTARKVCVRGSWDELSTDPSGRLSLNLPVGTVAITVFNPFHGVRELSASIDWAGEVETVEVVFAPAASVTGTVVDVDGVTPVPGATVELTDESLAPRTLTTNALGQFTFDLVPRGSVRVTAAADIDGVERVGVAQGRIGPGVASLDLTVRLKARGSVRGRVVSSDGSGTTPVPHAQVYVAEQSFPNRRLPAPGAWLTADADGVYQVGGVVAGPVRVVARDPVQPSRQGTTHGTVTADWQVVELPDIVLTTDVAHLEVTVRDPSTGAPLPDCQLTVRGSEGEAYAVSDSQGIGRIEALALGTWDVTAFHAPTGRTGRVRGIQLNEAHVVVEVTVYVDQRGEVSGTLWDDPGLVSPVVGGSVRLSGTTASGPMAAITTTSADPAGAFELLGVPAGSYSVVAAAPGSPRRARTTVELTDTAPVATLDLVLEPVDDVHVRVLERLSSGLSEVEPGPGELSVRLLQGDQGAPVYDVTLTTPEVPPPGHLYRFREVLTGRSASLAVQELVDEQRSQGVAITDWSAPGVDGAGTASDPLRLVLGPKGIVRVWVHGSSGEPVAEASVSVRSSGGGTFPSVTGGDGSVTFTAVPAGDLTATATASGSGLAGAASGVLTYDDEVVEMTVTLAPAVAAHGLVLLPPPGDLPGAGTTEPAAGAIVSLRDSDGASHTTVTDAAGLWQLDALAEGPCTVTARTADGAGIGSTSGTLAGPHGADTELPTILLDGSPPRVVAISPAPGAESVARTAEVRITFSEPLAPGVLPSGAASSPHFQLTSAEGAPLGMWDWAGDASGRPVVRFTPSAPYASTTTYALTVTGIRDRVDRPMASDPVGSSFTTTDSLGPVILTTAPPLERPVPDATTLRLEFNEAVVATAEQLDGDGVGDAATVSWAQSDGAGGWVWQPLPVTLALTVSDTAMLVDPVAGLELTDDTLLRRIVVSGLTDAASNQMEPDERLFRMRDSNPPVIDELPPPPEAPDGALTPGMTVTLTPSVSGLDQVPEVDPPGGDLDRVEYFLDDPDQAGGGATPVLVATEPPYAFTLVAPSPEGSTPRPLPVWARAVDTSENVSETARCDLEVLPNQPPTVSAVDAAAVAPVPGSCYPGSTVAATVHGLSDPDGSSVAVAVSLWRVGGGAPLDTAADLAVDRPVSGGWAALAPPVVQVTVPPDEPAGAQLEVRAIVRDRHGAAAEAVSAPLEVVADTDPPVISGLLARRLGEASSRRFVIGDRLLIELRAEDRETAVDTVTVAFDPPDLLPSPQAPALVAGTLYRTAELTVPHDGLTDDVTVMVTATATDAGGAAATAQLEIVLGPEPDPSDPTVEWLTPWDGAPWPAEHTAVTGAGGTPLELRLRADDTTGDGSPGTIVAVEIRGPVLGAGGPELAAMPVTAELDPETAGPGSGEYRAVWTVPDGLAAGAALPFEARVVDSGGRSATVPIQMVAELPRAVLEGVQTSVAPDDELLSVGGDPNGPVVLLDGATVSLYPSASGEPRQLRTVVLYAGGPDAPSVLTVPEVTSYAASQPFHPLELEIGSLLGVGAGCRIDVSGRGLLGSSDAGEASWPGVEPSERYAGGSHGGIGGMATVTTWTDPGSLRLAGGVSDSVHEPRLPGAGGGGAGSSAGSTGGGVVVVDALHATVRVAGAVRADGAGSTAAGAGAGGSLQVTAGRLVVSGELSASGGTSDRPRYGDGGGGRVAARVHELVGSAAALAARVAADGGSDSDSLAGAGTVLVQPLDEHGAPAATPTLWIAASAPGATLMPSLGNGEVAAVDGDAATVTVTAPGARGSVVGDTVVVRDGDGASVAELRVTAQTPIAGDEIRLDVVATPAALQEIADRLVAGETLSARAEHRYEAVLVTGSARVGFADDLVIGALADPAPSVNDRTAIDLGSNARVRLRGEAPQLAFDDDTTPAGEVSPGQTLDVHWSASDRLGVARTEERWSAPVTSDRVRWLGESQPVEVVIEPDRGHVTLPLDVALGPLESTVRSFGIDSGETVLSRVWQVVADSTSPQLELTLQPEAAGAIYRAGDVVEIVAAATDAVGVVEVTLAIDGGPPIVSGLETLTTQWSVPPVEQITQIEIVATASDAAGNTATRTRVVTVEPLDGRPLVQFVCPTSGARLPAGWDGLTLRLSATADEGLDRVELFAGDAVDPFFTEWPSGTSVTFTTPPQLVPTAAGPYVVRAVVTDSVGYTHEAALSAEVVEAVELTTGGTPDWGALESSAVWVRESVELAAPRAVGELIVVDGGVLSHPPVAPGAQQGVELIVSGTVYLGCGASIDVSERGYAENTTAPGALLPPHGERGAHLAGAEGTTFGALAAPREPGGGSRPPVGISGGAGGGVVRISAETIRLETSATIDASEAAAAYRGAGGSIWLSAEGPISGPGAIRGGWGGAVALEASWVDPALLERAAGVVFVRSPVSESRGDLLVRTSLRLPSVGGGVAASGSAGATLVTDRAELPQWLVGEWIEVHDGATDGLEGRYEIVDVDGGAMTLRAGDAGSPQLTPGDRWQRVLNVRQLVLGKAAAPAVGGSLSAADPIRADRMVLERGTLHEADVTGVGDVEVIDGTVTVPQTFRAPVTVMQSLAAQHLTMPTMTVEPGASVSWYEPYGEYVPARLQLHVAGTLEVGDGASIDVSALGFSCPDGPPGVEAGINAGGSHIGRGGSAETSWSSVGEAYGSVTRPLEPGAAGIGSYWECGFRGGGAVRIVAEDLMLNGTVRADGDGDISAYDPDPSGAGGSVWVTAPGGVTGSGSISARGGDIDWDGYAGGGGAIAIDGEVAPTVQLDAGGGNGSADPGAAGSIVIRSSGRPDLVVRETGSSTWSRPATVLPRLGMGVAQDGSGGLTLVTDRADVVPEWFVGHWVAVVDGDSGDSEGVWQISAVSDQTLTLDPAGGPAPELDPGDRWEGLYRFDSVEVSGGAWLLPGDRIDAGTTSGPIEAHNVAKPEVDLDGLSVRAHDGAFWLEALPGAIVDADGIVEATVLVAPWSAELNVAADGSFAPVVLQGAAGALVELHVADGHLLPFEREVAVGTLPVNEGSPVVDLAAVRLEGWADAARLIGDPGAVTDPSPPIQLEVTNLTAGGSWSGAVAADGSFEIAVVAETSDQLELAATDSHPDPSTGSVTFRPPDDPPAVDPGRVGVGAHDRRFWAWGASGAVRDDVQLASAWIEAGATPVDLSVAADGSFVEVEVPGGSGDILELVARDMAGQEGSGLLPPLPANDAPPLIDPDKLASGFDVYGALVVRSQGFGAPITSSDGVWAVRLENRTTPGFGPYVATVTDAGWQDAYSFTPTAVDGVAGDEIVLVVEDAHPEWLAAEVVAATMTERPGAPEVLLGQGDLVAGADGWWLQIPAGAVSDPEGHDPLTLRARVWRDSSGTWQEVATSSTTLASGEATSVLVADDAVGAEGDLVVVSVTDSDPLAARSTSVRVGILTTSGLAVDPDRFSLDQSQCQPVLVAGADAVTTDSGPVEILVTVTSPSGDVAYWTSPWIELEPGAPFTVELAAVEPGSQVVVRADDAAGASTTSVVSSAPVAPPDVDPVRISRTFADTETRISVSPIAITARTSTVRLELHNLDAGLVVLVSDPCSGLAVATVSSTPGDQLGLIACNGSEPEDEVCGDVVDLGTVGQEYAALDLDDAGVVDLWRVGPTVSVHTTDGELRVVSLDAPWQPEVLSWRAPVGSGVTAGAVARSAEALTYTDGDQLVRWSAATWSVTDAVQPLGPGVTIAATLVDRSRVVTAGAAPEGIWFAVTALDGSGAPCRTSAPYLLPDTAGAAARALAPLPNHTVGVVTDSLGIVQVDVADPMSPQPGWDDVPLDQLPEDLVRAEVEDDFVTVWGAGGEVVAYRLHGAGETASSPAVPAVDWSDPDGADVSAFTVAHPSRVVGRASGELTLEWSSGRTVTLPDSPVLALTEAHRSVFAATPSGIWHLLLEGETDGGGEVHTTQMRWRGSTVWMEPSAVSVSPTGTQLSFYGEGVNGAGGTEHLQHDQIVDDPWAPLTWDLAQHSGELTDVVWDSMIVFDLERRMYDWVQATAELDGPAYPDTECVPHSASCAADLLAVGRSWRAMAYSGGDTVSIRRVVAGEWQWAEVSAPGIRAVHASADGSRLWVAADEVHLVDPVSLWVDSASPFPGVGCADVLPVDGAVTLVAARTSMPVVAVVDALDASIITWPTELPVEGGAVVDLEVDDDGDPWLLLSEPNQLVELDASQLPGVAVAWSFDLDSWTQVLDLELGTPGASWIDAAVPMTFVLELGEEGAVSIVARPQAGEPEPAAQVRVPESATNFWVGECPDGELQVVVAAGAAGLRYSSAPLPADTWWGETWTADVGDARALAFAPEPFAAGDEIPEGCAATALSIGTKDSVPGCEAQLYVLSESGAHAVPFGVCGCAAPAARWHDGEER